MPGAVGNSSRNWWIAGCSAAILLTITLVCVYQSLNDQGTKLTDQAPETVSMDSGPESPYAPQDLDQFVGSSRCAACHAELAAAYRTHPMANSISKVSALPAGSEQASLIVPGVTRQYKVEMRDGEMWHHDEMFDAEGKSIFAQAVRMDYIVGSGRRAFAYLTQQNELMFQSPLNWYTQAAKWDLSPGYRPDDERRFRRRITDDCLSCHAGLVATVGEAPNRYQQPAFLEMSIGCEKCHGPGKSHIDFHESRSSTPGPIDPIVNPGHLGIVERESVCNQCHLQAAARVPRFGHSEFDFRPGQKLEEIWTAFDAGTDISDDGRTRAVNHVQQMRDSRCYTASNGQLGCISCHDPHRLPSVETKGVFYRQQCLKCHSSEACAETMPRRIAREDSCIACHMPHRDSNNISHVTQTDHRILRTTSSESHTESKGNVQLRFFDEAHKRMPQWEQNRALGVAVWSWLSKKGQQSPSDLAGLLESALVVQPLDGLSLSTLGALAMQHGRVELAMQYLTRAQQIPIAEEAAVAGLLDLFYQQANWTKSLEYVDRCLEIDPGHPGYHAIRADVLMNLGRLKEGIQAGEKSIELDPTRVAVRVWLANAYEKDGRKADADATRDVVRRMQTAKVPEP